MLNEQEEDSSVPGFSPSSPYDRLHADSFDHEDEPFGFLLPSNSEKEVYLHPFRD